MTTTAEPTTREERVARYADLFVEKFAERTSPIASLEGALFGNDWRPTGSAKVEILEGACQAAELIWEDRRIDAHRLSNQAIRQAQSILNSAYAYDRIALANVIKRAAQTLT